MLRITLVALLSIACLHHTTSCSSPTSSDSGKGLGVTREFSAPIAVTWHAMPEVLTQVGLQFVSENPQEGLILARIPSAGRGDYIAIFLDAIGGERTRVEVATKKVLAADGFATDWAEKIFEQLAQDLKGR